MKVYGGPFDGSNLPKQAREFLMLTFYDDGNPEMAQNYIYRARRDGWYFEQGATNAARRGLTKEEASDVDGE